MRLPARNPLGILSPAMGGLGFGIPAAIGIRMASPERQVVVLVGDGASLYSIQALWTAVRYRVGALIVVLANGGYAIMDRLMELEGGSSPWPGFPEIDFAALARAFGCPAEEVATPDELERCLDEVVPGLDGRESRWSWSSRWRPTSVRSVSDAASGGRRGSRREEAPRIHDHHLVDLLVRDALLPQRGQDLVEMWR